MLCCRMIVILKEVNYFKLYYKLNGKHKINIIKPPTEKVEVRENLLGKSASYNDVTIVT